ncbi:cytochrome c [Pararhizobium sp. IMCC21322]|uniref:c-type cytochrome n=1 Tax=Pararhizobium sp. IMCC21322 TaxID=3067903 RepID=UPI0027416375|nr:cytochrome c [Pararhizobium sp. IMCC21322]
MNKQTIIALVGSVAIALGAWWLLAPPANTGSGAPLAQVTVPQLNSAETAGRVLFDGNCAACHGADAAGRDGMAPPLVHVLYEPSHHADIAFQRAAKLGVRAHHWRFGDMPPVEGVTETDVGKITTYVRALQRANGIN